MKYYVNTELAALRAELRRQARYQKSYRCEFIIIPQAVRRAQVGRIKCSITLSDERMSVTATFTVR